MTIKQRIDSPNYTSTLTVGLASVRVSVLRAADRGAQGAYGQRVCASNPAPTRSSCFDGQSGCRVSSVGSRLVLAHTPGLAIVLPATGFGRCARPPFSPSGSFLPHDLNLRCSYHRGLSGSAPDPLFGAPKAVAPPLRGGTGGGPLR